MLGLDAALWFLSMRLIKSRLWRILASIFLAAQFTAFYLLMAGADWHYYAPKAVLTAVVTWHYFGFLLLLLLAAMRVWAWFLRQSKRRPRNDCSVPGAASQAVTRREFLSACTAMAPPLCSIGLTGIASAQLNEFRVRRFTLSVPTLPRVLEGLTLAHLTDVHIGPWTNGRVLRKIVETTNALRADLVLLTGDLIHYDLADLSAGIALAKALEGRHGVWMAEGNHDLLDNGGEFERRVKAAGLQLLLGESGTTAVRGYPVQVFGLRWIGSASVENPAGSGNEAQRDRSSALQLRAAMRQEQPEAFPIVLSHHPHAFDAAAEVGLPLMLAGHTHGGQWMLGPRLGAGPLLFRYWSGLYQRGRSQLIVSNGVGNVLPLRISAPAEIVHVTLRCAR